MCKLWVQNYLCARCETVFIRAMDPSILERGDIWRLEYSGPCNLVQRQFAQFPVELNNYETELDCARYGSAPIQYGPPNYMKDPTGEVCDNCRKALQADLPAGVKRKPSPSGADG